jgi:heme/copper-type cytochrome/quinol oxidase subunit 2
MRSILPTVALAALWLSGAISLLATDVPARTVAIVADKDNRFKLADGKGPLVLKSGEKVTFRITAVFGGEKARDGSVHSFVVRKLRDQGWDVRLKEGVQEFTLTAPPAGEYLIECTVKCGPGHDDMNLKMVVQ